MEKLLLVALGGAVGSAARYLVGLEAERLTGAAWPWGTLTVNVVGGFLMGAVVGYLAGRSGADPERWRLLLAVGGLGGFTTFSAYSLETFRMIEARQYGQAAGYTALSVALSILALFIGLVLARKVFA